MEYERSLIAYSLSVCSRCISVILPFVNRTAGCFNTATASPRVRRCGYSEQMLPALIVAIDRHWALLCQTYTETLDEQLSSLIVVPFIIELIRCLSTC